MRSGPIAAQLERMLAPWLTSRPWFPPLVDIRNVGVLAFDVLNRSPLDAWMDIVVTDGGGAELVFQLLVTSRPGADQDRLGVLDVPARPVTLYDGFSNREVVLDAARHADPGREFTSVTSIDDRSVTFRAVLDDTWEYKVFRRLETGSNPDVEVPVALARLGLGHVPPPVGVVRRDGVERALVRHWLRPRTDAAQVARRAVVELLDRRVTPRETVADIADEAEQMGQVVADFHLTMAEGFGVESASGDAWSDAMMSELTRRSGGRVNLKRLAAVFQRLRRAGDLGMSIRGHGSLELTRLVKNRHWVVVDFEGDGTRLFDELRVPVSPLRDVADVLSAFSNVAAEELARRTDAGSRPDRELALLAEAFEERAGDHFIAGYTSRDEVHRLLPREREARDALVAIFELEGRLRRLLPEVDREPRVGPTPPG